MIEVAHIVARITTDLTRFNAGMMAAEARATTMSEKMGVAGMRATKYLTLPLLGVGYAAAKASFHYTDALTAIRTQTGATTKQVEKFSDAFKKMSGTSVVQGPEELAQAMYHVQSVVGNNSGWTMTQKLNALKAAAHGAQLGFAPLEQTTSALMGVLRTNIKGTGDYEQAMATLNATVGAGNVKFDALIGALGTGIVPTAKLAGLSLQDIGASLAVFTDENVNANSAMTRLRTGLMMMQSPSSKAEKAMEAFGLSGQKLGEIIRGPGGWAAAIQLIHDRYDAFVKAHGGGRAAETMAFRNLSVGFGGSKTASTIMLLVNQSEMLRQKEEQIAKGRKRWNSDLAYSNKQLTTQMRKAWDQVRIALIDLGAVLLPIVASILKHFAAMVRWWSKLPAPIKEFTGYMLIGLAVLGPMLIAIGSVVRMVKSLRVAWLAVRDAEVAAWIAALGPISLVAAAIILIGGLILILLWRSKRFRAEWNRIFQGLGADLYDFVQGWNRTWQNIGATFYDFVQNVAGKWNTLMGMMLHPVANFEAGMGIILNRIKNAWIRGMTAIGSWIKRKFMEAINWLIDHAVAAYNAAKDFGANLARGVLDGLGNVADQILDKIDPLGLRHVPGKAGGLAAGLVGAGGGAQANLLHQHAPGKTGRYTHPTGAANPGTTTRSQPSRKPASIHIEHQHIHNRETAEVTMRKMTRLVTQ